MPLAVGAIRHPRLRRPGASANTGAETLGTQVLMVASAPDSTKPPLSTRSLRVCPKCRMLAPAGAGWEVTCGEHGLAFVESRALTESGNDPLLGTTLAGRFTILSRIGAGSMGSVYRARQAAVGR